MRIVALEVTYALWSRWKLITNLKPSSFCYCQHERSIEWRVSNQTLLSGRFGNLNTLGTLELCGNNITKPPKAALGALRSLQNLHLCQNQLTQLKKDAFGTLPVVSRLDLSGNKIFNVSYSAFEGLRQVTDIDLSFNNLSWIPPGAFLGIFYFIYLK